MLDLPEQAPRPEPQQNMPPPIPPEPEKKSRLKTMWDLLVSFFLFYVLAIFVLYLAQGSLMYHPDRSPPGSPELYHLGNAMEEIYVTTRDDLSLLGWWAEPQRRWKPTIVYFHGNAGNIGVRSTVVYPMIQEDYGVLLAEYRGYGGNKGSPSEEGFYTDARAFIDWLLDEQGLNQSDLVLYGESIGSGVAVQMAKEYPNIRGLIIQSGFTSAVDVASDHYPWVPVRYLLRDRYDNLGKINEITAPILIGHGRHDRVVNFDLGRSLYDAANHPKTFVELENAGHNDTHDQGFGRHVLEFLRDISPRRF